MPRFLRSVFLVAAAGLAAVACYIAVTLPPRAVALSVAPPPGVVFGAYHIHSTRSDGSGTPDEIAAAAARAGLAFVIVTDHGNGTRTPDPPAYRHGVLCLDGVEVNTFAGHLVVLGLAQPAPYPLAGEAIDVVDDAHRLGGWTVVAHPDSPNPDLRWRAWGVPYDAVEWINADSEWRDDSPMTLAGTVLRSVVRPAESVASLFTRPSRTLQRWDATNQARAVVALAAVDAHARFDWRNTEPRPRTLIARPRYEDMFRTLAQGVWLDAPLTGSDAPGDAARLLRAIEAGQTFSIVRAFAAPAFMSVTADQGGRITRMGGRLPDMSPMQLVAAVPGVPDADVLLLRDGTVIARGKGEASITGAPSPGAYRAEAYFPGFSVPWLVANPIYAGAPPVESVVVPPPVAQSPEPIALGTGWRTELDRTSTATLDSSPQALMLTYALGGGQPAGQYAAAVTEVPDAEAIDAVTFRAHADRPMRVSLQLRLISGRRWRQSVYLDGTARTVTVPLQSFEPVDPQGILRPTAARIRSLLVVVDTLNALPGTKGTVTIEALTLNKAPADGGAGAVRFER